MFRAGGGDGGEGAAAARPAPQQRQANHQQVKGTVAGDFQTLVFHKSMASRP